MRKRDDPRQQRIAGRLLEATIHLRQASLVYHSQSSDRIKTYLVHPYRLAHAQGGLYLLAYVPEYQQVRTFAIERTPTPGGIRTERSGAITPRRAA